MTPTPPLRRNRAFALLTGGWFVDGVTMRGVEFVIPLIALVLTGSGKAVGVVGAAGALGMVLGGLPAGTVADRYNRKRVIVAANGVQALAVTQAGSVTQARQALAGTIGAPLGGLWLSVSRALPFLVGVLGACVAAVATLLVPHRLDVPRGEHEERRSAGHEMLDGLRFIRRDGPLSGMVAIAVILNFAMNGAFLALVLQRQQAGWRPGQLGLMETALSVGMIVGALASGPIIKVLRGGTVMLVCTVAFCLGLVALAASTDLWVSLAVLLVTSIVLPSANVVAMTYQMLVTPNVLQGRVSATLGTLCMAAMPVAPIVAGFLLDWVGGAWTVVAFAGVMALAVPIQLGIRALRTMPLLADIPPVEDTAGSGVAGEVPVVPGAGLSATGPR